MSDRLVHGDGKAAEYISRRCKIIFNPRADRCIHRERDGRILGGFIYSHWTRESCAMHMAGGDPHWISRYLAWAAFDYPFNQLGCNRVFGHFMETNVVSMGIARKAGFKPVAYIPGVYRHNVGKIIAVLERDDCRYLKLGERYSKEEPTDG